MRVGRRVWIVGLALAACAGEPAPICDEAASVAPLTAPDRHLLGEAIPLARDPSIRAREEELGRSMAARRALGWELAGQLLAPVEVQAGARALEVPRFATWLDREDLRRVHRALPPGPPTDAALDQAIADDRDAVLAMEAWPADRLAAYIAAVDDPVRANGLGGVSRVLYDPIAARHLLRSEAALLACRGRAFAPLEAGPGPAAPTDVALTVSGCGEARGGPYFVADGGALRVTHGGLAEVTLTGAPARCDEAGCEVDGPARVELTARAVGPEPATVRVRFDDASAFWVPCLDGAMPDGAAIVKADYRRVGFGFEVGAPDLSPAALEALRAGDGDWANATPEAGVDPGPDAIHTVELAGGERYRLVGLHAMVKELDHWVWLTLFWTPEASGFAADRPAGLEGPLARYGMCVVTDFVEGDPDPAADAPPGLDEVLAATFEGEGGSTWCSNPHIEEGAGNARTNCVGCHQHAGAGLTSEEVLTLDDFGRPLARVAFPNDYVFSTQDLVDIFLEP